MGPSVARKEKGTGILPSTSDGNFSRGYPGVSRAIVDDEAGLLHGRLSLRYCRENFNSGDFFLAIFSPVASPVRGWLHVRFSSRARDATKFEKIASPARAKNRS